MAGLDELNATSVAVIGMAARLPGAPDLEAFWRLLLAGEDAVRRFERQELLAAGWRPDEIDAPGFVPARAALLDAGDFDAALFGMSPSEAARTDPQHRLFLECCLLALEDAALDPARFPGFIGVFGACSENTYLARCLLPALGPEALEGLQGSLANDKDHMVLRASYKLGLTGPSVLVQASCASGLVAIHQAAQALLSWQCDVALAGAASVTVPIVGGRRHRPGDITSLDGRTRTFDAQASGTVGGDGAGVVVLRRLEDALEAGDPIRAILRGSAINNDGGRKVGYSAPSLVGQAECVRLALSAAGIAPGSLSFVEAHGTATPMGDPVEVSALAAAFGPGLPAGSCALGSVKSNLGHLNAASGVAGFLKAALALERGLLPPTLHFSTLNPEIELSGTPFYIAATPVVLARAPLRAGLSSFGAGGTNAHAILEAPPTRPPSPPGGAQVLVLSGRTAEAAAASARSLADWIEARPELSLDDVALTLLEGRRAWSARLAVAVTGRQDAIAALRDRARWRRGQAERRRPVLYFLPAHGAQRVGMGRGLMEVDPVFRASMTGTLALCSRLLGEDLAATLYPVPGGEAAAAERLADQRLAGPALFCLSCALADRWRARGVHPDAVLGHSLGEIAGAVIAGALSLEEGARLTVARARALDALPRGAGLHVPLAAEDLAPLLVAGTHLALRNGPRATVVTGHVEAIAALDIDLRMRGVRARPVAVSFAAHSPLVAPAVPALLAAVPSGDRPLSMPFFTGVGGGLLEGPLRPDHWARQLVEPSDLMGAVGAAEARLDPVVLELGPRGCGGIYRLSAASDRVVVPSLAEDGEDPRAASLSMLDAAGALWAAGAAIPTEALRGGAGGRRVSLPGYPLERRRCWIDPPDAPAPPPASPADPRAASTLEARLCALAADLLGVEAIGPEDSFLALGGDSLYTLRLVDEIQRRLGLSLPSSAAWTALSVSQILALLPEDRPRPGRTRVPRCLVPLRESGARPPLYVAHPLAGIVFPFVPLTRALGPDQPVYGLQAAGVDGDEAPDLSIEAMAARYLAAIQQLQPIGPVHLAGYSFGALVAYEMARQLGDRVGALVLIDELAPVDGNRPGMRALADLVLGPAGRTFLHHLGDYLTLAPPPGQERGLRASVERAALAALLPSESRDVVLARPALGPLLRLARVHWRETFRYAPGPWSGRALVVRSEHWSAHARLDRSARDPALGWGRLVVGRVDILEVSGDHLEIIRDPHVSRLAEGIRGAMEIARSA